MERTCKKCGRVKTPDDFPVHYEWCYECLNMQPRRYKSWKLYKQNIFLGEGRVCNKCHTLKPLSSYDTSKWICQFPNISSLTCAECRNIGKSKYYRRKEEKRQIEIAERIIEENKFYEWKSDKYVILDAICSTTGLSKRQLYRNKEFAELVETHIKCKRLLKTKRDENSNRTKN